MQSTRLRKDHIHAISAGFLSLHCKHAMHGPGCWQLSDLTLPAMTETPAPPRVSTAPPSWKLWEFALAADPSQCSPAKHSWSGFMSSLLSRSVRIYQDLSGRPSKLGLQKFADSWQKSFVARSICSILYSRRAPQARRPQNAGGTQYAYVCLKV